MENPATEIQKQKNSSLSIGLIILNICLILIFFNSTGEFAGQGEINLLIVVFSATVLTGAYAFSYHGRGYRIAKWIFAILLLISLFFIGILFYISALGHAFQH